MGPVAAAKNVRSATSGWKRATGATVNLGTAGTAWRARVYFGRGVAFLAAGHWAKSRLRARLNASPARRSQAPLQTKQLPAPATAPPAAHMATQQDEGGVPFSLAHSFQQLRLLELPPELVALLDSASPPPYVPHCDPGNRNLDLMCIDYP
jgi:hypothetical protein